MLNSVVQALVVVGVAVSTSGAEEKIGEPVWKVFVAEGSQNVAGLAPARGKGDIKWEYPSTQNPYILHITVIITEMKRIGH